ncbi:MAG: hypothetical protein C4348_00510 [Patescibacteria group bacterium]
MDPLSPTPQPMIKNKKSFTLLEIAIVIFLFSFIVTVVSTIYINLTNASIIANDYYQALENVRLGSEKIWRTLKYGWNFNLVNNQQLDFQKKDCTSASLKFNSSTKTLEYIEYSEGNPLNYQAVFDPNLVKVNDIIIATDTPRSTQRYDYFQYSTKLIVIYYDLEIKSKRGVTSSLIFEQAVAPLNSVYQTPRCQ